MLQSNKLYSFKTENVNNESPTETIDLSVYSVVEANDKATHRVDRRPMCLILKRRGMESDAFDLCAMSVSDREAWVDELKRAAVISS